MTNASASRSRPRGGANPLSMLVHGGKTVKLIGAVMADPRVHWSHKFAFVGTIGALLLAFVFPELLADAGLGFLTAGLFDFVGVPAEVGIDWTVFAIAAFNLLKLFPTDIIAEHYNRIFRGR